MSKEGLQQGQENNSGHVERTIDLLWSFKENDPREIWLQDTESARVMVNLSYGFGRYTKT